MMPNSDRDRLYVEIDILKNVRHPNVVEYMGSQDDKHEETMYIFMELCSGGDLFSYIADHAPCAEDLIWRVLSQLVSALYACHHDKDAQSRVIVHNDLKPENSKFQKIVA